MFNWKIIMHVITWISKEKPGSWYISACLYSQNLGVRYDNLKVIVVYMRPYVKQFPKI